MKIYHTQGSPEWLEYRRSRIMGTDAPIILDVSPFARPIDLWNEKMQLIPPKEETEAMKQGKILEPEARALACEILQLLFEPAVIQSDEYFWQAASLDGIADDIILEIKCPFSERSHQMAIDKLIPEHYEIQIQHQLAVTNARMAFYFSYRPKSKQPWTFIEVKPNYDLIDHLIAKEEEFYLKHMCEMNEPIDWKLEKRTE